MAAASSHREKALPESPAPLMRRRLAICCGLILLTALAYAQAAYLDFAYFDDPQYVTTNVFVQGGLTWDDVIWAFTTGEQSNWHPLTWLSHMVDCEMFGIVQPGGHHVVNVAFHLANTVLLYLILESMTGATWQSAMVALLFGVHPAHVESVAWVAERKDVLSTLLGLLTLRAYVTYVRQPSLLRYGAVAGLLGLGLLTKPMLVTLPCVFLLLDYWPLDRMRPQSFAEEESKRSRKNRKEAVPRSAVAGEAESSSEAISWDAVRWLVLEKLPLMAIVVTSSVITFLVQRAGGSVAALGVLPLDDRILNALISYARYVKKAVWPANLAAFYPRPDSVDFLQAMIAAAVLVAISVGVVLLARRGFRYLPVGWFWFLGTLVPVIGLVQVGDQAMADRYTYIPYIGLFIALVWGATDALTHWRQERLALWVLAVMSIINCLVLTSAQLIYWRNTEGLMRRIIEVSPDCAVAYNNLAVYLWENGREDEAMEHWRTAIRVGPQAPDAWGNYGTALRCRGRPKEAEPLLRTAIKLKPFGINAHNNLGMTLWDLNKREEAVGEMREAIRLDPANVDARRNLAMFLNDLGQYEEARTNLREALRLRPNDASTWNSWGVFQAGQGQWKEAETAMRRSISLHPRANGFARRWLVILLLQEGRLREALEESPELARSFPLGIFLSDAASRLLNVRPDTTGFDLVEGLYAEAGWLRLIVLSIAKQLDLLPSPPPLDIPQTPFFTEATSHSRTGQEGKSPGAAVWEQFRGIQPPSRTGVISNDGSSTTATAGSSVR